MRYSKKVISKCGPGKLVFRLTDFIFRASCKKHDAYYKKGGSIIRKIMADAFFYAYMLEDIVKGDFKWYIKLFYFIIATLYIIIVLILGIIPWVINTVKNKYETNSNNFSNTITDR